ncbi:cytochrome P450 [Actinomadura kijaniata]|uniref:Cytochrome P450 n=1 Tax=Actinomadura namibiensis TaxID=182080 RepID=A0A7W3LMV2_ACTNM|nr:cytochrome P450 [Actinomadura namibiensis]MBA8951050.1 cytochrome P450 [Actinomadura namibiensis]
MTETELLFNPFEPGYTDDPYPTYRRMRETDPVHDHPFGLWMVTRYEDAVTVLRSKLSVEEKLVNAGMLREQYDAIDADTGAGTILSLSMLDRDPPDHTRLRSLVAKVFTPRSVGALEPQVAELVDEGLDRIAADGGGDLVESLAFPLPFEVISRMLGLPPTDHLRIRELSGWLVRSLEPVPDDETLARVIAAGDELAEIARDLIAYKREHPGDDLLTAMIAAEEDGDRLSDDELVAQLVLLYVAGHETTVNLVANGTVALLRNPDQLALLRERPELAANAVEEFLRYDSPVQQTRRVTTAPFELGGKVIPEGSFVSVVLASANRDEAFWGPDADRLRIDRDNARQHVSFGSGVHHCLGAALARLEGRVAFERLVTRFPGLAPGGEVRWNGRINLRGPAELPITV